MAPERMSQSRFQKKYKDSLWELSAVYDMDCKNIAKWIHDEAEMVLNPNIGAHHNDLDSIKTDAYGHYAKCSEILKSLYNLGAMTVRSQLMDDAKKGLLKLKAPETSTIWTWLVTSLMALFLELAVIGFLISMGASITLFLMGGLLVVCLIMGGMGLGQLMILLHGYHGNPDADDVADETQRWPWLAILLPSLAFGGLIAIAAVRAISTNSYITGIRGPRGR